MFVGMGIQYAGTLLGCVALLLVPIPVGFLLWGRRLREKSTFSPTMGDKPPPEEEEESEREEGEGRGVGGGAGQSGVDMDMDSRIENGTVTGTVTGVGDEAGEKKKIG